MSRHTHSFSTHTHFYRFCTFTKAFMATWSSSESTLPTDILKPHVFLLILIPTHTHIFIYIHIQFLIWHIFMSLRVELRVRIEFIDLWIVFKEYTTDLNTIHRPMDCVERVYNWSKYNSSTDELPMHSAHVFRWCTTHLWQSIQLIEIQFIYRWITNAFSPCIQMVYNSSEYNLFDDNR